jgi:GNAT superfamily N-acetyltransferase
MTTRLWEPTVADHAALVQAQNLYERCLDADERIPWVWIERSVIEHESGNGWRKHLILASVDDQLAGLVYGAFLPGFGGYLCYVAINEQFRKLGLATKLYDAFFRAMRNDAEACGESLPFVLWESHRPEDDPRLWQARVKLFERVGGKWVAGLNLMTPDYSERDAAPVPLQVFLKPMDETVFSEERLRAIIDELLIRVYGQDPGDELYDATMNTMTAPALTATSASLTPL